MKSVHFDDRATWIAALSDEDAERVAALNHARLCAKCAAALAEGLRSVKLIDAALALPDASLEAEEIERRAVVLEAQVAAENRRGRVLPAVAVLVAWLVEVIIAKKLATDRASWVFSILVLGLGGTIAAYAKGGRKAAAVAIAISALFAVAVGSAAPLAAGIGVKCTLLEIVAALIPWAAFVWTARGEGTTSQGAAAAAAGALAGHAALHLSCPVRHAEPHLLVFHLGGVVLACVLGGLFTLRAQRALHAG